MTQFYTNVSDMYGPLNIHEVGIPLRLHELSMSPTVQIDISTVDIANPQTEKSPSYVRNSEHLRKLIQSVLINNNRLLIL